MHETRMLGGFKIGRGSPYLFGSVLQGDGCHFTVFSKNAQSVTLHLFDDYRDAIPGHSLELDPVWNRTGDVWHIFVFDIKEGQYYGYSVDGPFEPEKGHRFNKHKLLGDPYTCAVGGQYHWEKSAPYGYDRNSELLDLSLSTQTDFDIEAKSVVVDDSDFDWTDDRHPCISLKDTIIYEAHVRSLTRHPLAGVENAGTFLGVVEKIPYLKELGITTLELLPIQDFNENENFQSNPFSGERLKQYWGYSTLAFFAPNSWYATDRSGITAVREFKEMVRALHKAGIEIILDVVYNHTGEGNEFGPTLSFRGLDNSIYYMLEEDGRHYKNYSGCGNTLNCNHPVVKRLILDSLRYWVVDMHVDGFRFDLAAILGRDSEGNWLPNHSVLSDISHDPILSNTKIIAESWDAAGLYTVGGFPDGWAEWNGKFRDDVRRFVKGDEGMVGEIAKRITGSSDLFAHRQGRPYHSINFITAHDGFTLADVVSYNEKHNEINGENNNDGENNNYSWNCGIEGPTDDPSVLKIRDRLMKNLTALLFISQGTPMINSGDEFAFSKKGNNNSYCQDNEINWLDWSLLEKNSEFFGFFKYMLEFRKRHPALKREHFFTGMDHSGDEWPDISWHGFELNEPDWTWESRALAFMIDGSAQETGADQDDNNIYVAMNSDWEAHEFKIPAPAHGKKWYLAVDTGILPGYYEFGQEPPLCADSLMLHARSMVILIEM